jgi:hypothetical protein
MLAEVRRTAWHDRLIFNTFSHPFPYLFHRWDVYFGEVYEHYDKVVWSWAKGFWFRREAEEYAHEIEGFGYWGEEGLDDQDLAR